MERNFSRREFFIGASAALAAAAQTNEVRVFASNGIKAALEDLTPQCERAAGRKLAIQFNSSTALKPMIDKGEPFDLAIVTLEMLEQLIKEGKIAAGSRALLGRSSIGLAVRSGAPKPDIRTAESLKRILLNAKSITFAQDGASRAYIEKMFDRMGIAAQVKPKLMLEQGSTRSTGRVAAGEVELVMTLISEILPVKGIDLAGPLPAEFQGYVTMAAGVGAKAANRDAAAAVIKFLSSPSATPVFKAKGLERL